MLTRNLAFSCRKCTMSYILLLLTPLVNGYGTANAQNANARKAAMQHAMEMVRLIEIRNNTTAASPNIEVPLELRSYLVSPENLIVTDPDGKTFDSENVAVLPAGTHSFTVKYVRHVRSAPAGGVSSPGVNVGGGVSVSASVSFSAPATPVYSTPVHLETVFEPGKYYTFEYERIGRGIFKTDSLTATFIELTDDVSPETMGRATNHTLEAAKEKLTHTLERAERSRAAMEDYIAFSEANPGILEGVYDRSKNVKMELTFNGDRFIISASILGAHYLYEGTFRYNENTIVAQVGFLTKNGKERKPHKGTECWYYSQEEGTLNITGQIAATVFNMKGEYIRKTE